VKVRTLRILAAALGISCGTAAVAQEPAKLKLTALEAKAAKATPAQAGNQKLADAVASKLADVTAMKTADVKLYTDNGTVTVLGTCKDASDKTAILKAVSTADGVTLVKDGLKTSDVKQVQAIGGPRVSMPASATPPAPVSAPVPAPMMGGGAPMMGGMSSGAPMMGNPDVEPMPLGQAGGGMAMQAPPLPNHAWPTYAPYPNMSRVGYPTAYPYNAFPYIGPYYPFPKVPLGWRSVTLSWEDGHWWLGRKQTPQDYWRVKFGY
jgi:hypothetical protein